MFTRMLTLALAGVLSASSAAAGPIDDFIEADLLAAERLAKAAPGDDAVGDAASFGRNVKWLGLLQSGSISLRPSCVPAPGDPPLGPDDRCVSLNPAPAVTSFDLPDIGRIKLPGKSAKSLLCHWLSPILGYTFENTTGVYQPNASLRLSPYIVIESPVFADPSLIDPGTGLPLGGRLETGFAATYIDARSMQPGDRQFTRHSQSRTCIAGFLSRRNLIQGYGLSEAQADDVFRKDMVLSFGLRGSAGMVSNANVLYGLRVVGD
jgi:hypothetical protein